MENVEFVCDSCGSEFTSSFKGSVGWLGVCKFGDEDCDCNGRTYYDDCPNCFCALQSDVLNNNFN